MKMTINSIKCTPFNRMKFSKKLLKGFPDIFVEFFFGLIFADFIGIMKLTIVRIQRYFFTWHRLCFELVSEIPFFF